MCLTFFIKHQRYPTHSTLQGFAVDCNTLFALGGDYLTIIWIGSVNELGNDKNITKWIEGNYICIYDESGRIKGHIGIQYDITEHVNEQNKLVELLKTFEEDFTKALELAIEGRMPAAGRHRRCIVLLQLERIDATTARKKGFMSKSRHRRTSAIEPTEQSRTLWPDTRSMTWAGCSALVRPGGLLVLCLCVAAKGGSFPPCCGVSQ